MGISAPSASSVVGGDGDAKGNSAPSTSSTVSSGKGDEKGNSAPSGSSDNVVDTTAVQMGNLALG